MRPWALKWVKKDGVPSCADHVCIPKYKFSQVIDKYLSVNCEPEITDRLTRLDLLPF